jgi:hypothetical protein
MPDEKDTASQELRELLDRAESAPDSSGEIDTDPGPGPQPNLNVPVTPGGYPTTPGRG